MARDTDIGSMSFGFSIFIIVLLLLMIYGSYLWILASLQQRNFQSVPSLIEQIKQQQPPQEWEQELGQKKE